MGLFTKKIGPVFLKEESDTQEYIAKMQALLAGTDESLKSKIEKQINLAKYGEYGESNIAFELKNSGMDMYILHDIYLETENLAAQIDYIVITRKMVYVIECKNLIGNIEIDNTGAFIRSYEWKGRRIKEGIYSPITQNQRHLQVLKAVRKNAKNNFLTKMIFEKNFNEIYKSIVVLANPKTYLNARYAKKEIKEQVIRADRLVSYIRETDKSSANMEMSSDEMLKLAQFYLGQNIPQRSDYTRKYEEMAAEVEAGRQKAASEAQEMLKESDKEGSIDREMLIGKLKAYRLEQSRKENCKPYHIFNDRQMNDLLDKFPRNKDELLKVSGFGNVKVEKYGDQILLILHS